MTHKCPTCRRRFLTRNRLAAHEWQCPSRLATAADWLLTRVIPPGKQDNT